MVDGLGGLPDFLAGFDRSGSSASEVPYLIRAAAARGGLRLGRGFISKIVLPPLSTSTKRPRIQGAMTNTTKAALDYLHACGSTPISVVESDSGVCKFSLKFDPAALMTFWTHQEGWPRSSKPRGRSPARTSTMPRQTRPSAAQPPNAGYTHAARNRDGPRGNRCQKSRRLSRQAPWDRHVVST
jgi:hypothetical protein